MTIIVVDHGSTPSVPATGYHSLYPKADGWYGLDHAGTEVGPFGTFDYGTLLEGCRLIWNSATSISVSTGRCVTESGDLIDVTSTLTASGLSLSASTFYHVYVYLSGGSPAVRLSVSSWSVILAQ